MMAGSSKKYACDNILLYAIKQGKRDKSNQDLFFSIHISQKKYTKVTSTAQNWKKSQLDSDVCTVKADAIQLG